MRVGLCETPTTEPSIHRGASNLPVASFSLTTINPTFGEASLDDHFVKSRSILLIVLAHDFIISRQSGNWRCPSSNSAPDIAYIHSRDSCVEIIRPSNLVAPRLSIGARLMDRAGHHGSRRSSGNHRSEMGEILRPLSAWKHGTIFWNAHGNRPQPDFCASSAHCRPNRLSRALPSLPPRSTAQDRSLARPPCRLHFLETDIGTLTNHRYYTIPSP